MGDFRKMEDFISKKYNLSILRELLNSQQGVGFNSLIKSLEPITARVLSLRLKELEKEGFLQKNLVLGAKPKIEYRASQKAEGLRKAIKELEKFEKNLQ